MLSAITFLSLAVLPGPCLRSQPHTATFSLHDTQGSKDELPDLEKQVSRVSLYYVRPQRVHEYTIITIGFIAFEAHAVAFQQCFCYCTLHHQRLMEHSCLAESNNLSI